MCAAAIARSHGELPSARRYLATADSWRASRPARTAAVTGALLIGLGVFTVVYWDVRLPSMFGYGWFPTMPYNN